MVGVAETREFHRRLVARDHGIEPAGQFTSWEDVAAVGKRLADAVIIATQDHMHTEPAIRYAGLGYHILLEKPMAVTAQDCRKIVAAVKAAGVIFGVGHVLRYTPYMRKMKELTESIGRVINVQHLEPIGDWHFTHSYVRGSWANEARSTFMLMAKCCHDIDLIRHLMGKPCERVSSFGDLSMFRSERKPREAGSATRCVACPLVNSCAYSAKRLYLDQAESGYFGWPVSLSLIHI